MNKQALRGQPTAVRFFAKVNRDGPVPDHDPSLGPCWAWTASQQRAGYGKFGMNRGYVLAHRWSYEHHVGPIPDGRFVLHRCDNRTCVNPDHLYLGTQTDNMRDMVSRGRSSRGRDKHTAKLTEWDVRDIREMWANDTCTLTQDEIAEGYGVRKRAIWSLLHGRTWAWVEDL